MEPRAKRSAAAVALTESVPGMEDAELIERSIEALAEAVEDISPQVYDRFFAKHPETRALFGDELGRSRMLHEVLWTCLDLAKSRSYVPISIASIASDHTTYGDIPLRLYRDFLDDFLQEMAELLGSSWTPDVDAAWRRQAGGILEIISTAIHEPAD